MTTTSPVDPTLASLVPLPSRGRNGLLLIGAVAAVLAAGWLGTLAGLWVQPRSASIDLEPDGHVVYLATMRIPSGPGIIVHDVRAPEGTTLEGLWVLRADDPDPTVETLDTRELVTALAADTSRPTTLPQPAGSGTLRFAMLLRVDDCTRLTEDGVAGTPDADGSLVSHPPTLTLVSPLGTASSVDLTWFGWPEADLQASGACR